MKGIPEIKNIDPQSSEVKKIREHIALNLKETAQSGKLAHSLYFVKYRLKKNEHFYLVMAKMSQNMDTLSSLNRLPHPGAVGQGDSMLIPSARGIFLEGNSSSELASQYHTAENRLIPVSKNRWFLPGGLLPSGEVLVFRGEGFAQPLRNLRITSRYGLRTDPFSKRSTFHGGIDLGAPMGAAVHASREGTVIRSGEAGGYGNLVVILHPYGYTTYYGHLSKIIVKNGQKISSGELIGLVGDTGKAIGPHLHFEVRKHGIQKNPKFIHNDSSAVAHRANSN
jgi:murein DD-endopeptidase MepM/ murein hydrolase activator NlpD